MRKGQKHKESSKRLLSAAVSRAHKRGDFKHTYFKKGHKAWNKGKSMLAMGFIQKNPHVTVGKDHPCWKGGIQRPVKDCALVWSGSKKTKRRPREIYKKFHGPIPKGYVIYHIDGNNKNDHPRNLEAISRKELRRRNLITGRWQRK